MPRLSPRSYRRVTLVALVALAFIIVSGAAVRLTGSGLGCPDWPTCAEDRIVAPLEYHAMIEFVNRMVTGVVSVAVIVAVLGSLARVPRRRDLVVLSLGLVAGVLGQIVLGGLTVLFHLHPVLVMSHFLLSMVILANAVVLHSRAGQLDGPPAPVVARPLRRLAWVTTAVAAVVVFTGTIVTASGPHGGDEDVRRLGFQVHDVARVHGGTVVALLALTLTTVVVLRRHQAPPLVQRRGVELLAVLLAQAAIGYVQYFTGVPVLLVGAHILGAVLVWSAALRLPLSMTERREPVAADAVPEGARSPGPEPVPA